MVAPQLVLGNKMELLESIDIEVPLHDVVPSSMVKMIISEYGADSPDYIFRVFAEHYSDHDYGYKFD